MGERQFDYDELLDDLRCRETAWLAAAREEAVREQRQWRLRELAITSVLDERHQVDDSLAGRDGTSTRAARRTRRTAQMLQQQPHLARKAAEGALSEEQLDRLSDLAGDDPDADREWAAQGAGWSPEDLAEELRRRRKPTVEDAAARREARELRYWWNRGAGMLDGRFSLPDIDGAVFEKVFDELIERMRPAKGQPWDSREHRGADALVELCRAHLERDPNAPTSGYRAHLVVHVPTDGPATVAGVPLPDEMVERLRAEARIEPVLVDAAGDPIVVGRTTSVLSEKTKRAVKVRDGHCRWPGCDHRRGLQVHHLWPASWGGPDAIHNLATVCTAHHARLAPQGDKLLLGNPNTVHGLALVHRDELATLAADRARAGPDAA